MNVNNSANSTQFFDYFNTIIEKKIDTSSVLKLIFKNDETAQDQRSRCATLTPLDAQQLEGMPNELQGIVLDYAQNPAHFSLMKMLFGKKAVTQQTIQLLKRIDRYTLADRTQMVISRLSAEEYLWSHIFQEVRGNCTVAELEEITNKFVEFHGGLIQSTANKTRGLFEKIAGVVSAVLENWIVRIAIGLTVGFYIYRIARFAKAYIESTIVPIIVNKIINHSHISLIRAGNWLYDQALKVNSYFAVFFLLYLALCFVPNGPKNIFLHLQRGIGKIVYVLFIPIRIANKIAWLPFDLAVMAFNRSQRASAEAGKIIKEGKNKSQAARISQQMELASRAWVNHIVNVIGRK